MMSFSLNDFRHELSVPEEISLKDSTCSKGIFLRMFLFCMLSSLCFKLFSVDMNSPGSTKLENLLFHDKSYHPIIHNESLATGTF